MEVGKERITEWVLSKYIMPKYEKFIMKSIIIYNSYILKIKILYKSSFMLCIYGIYNIKLVINFMFTL